MAQNPADRVRAAVDRWGEAAVVAGCGELLTGAELAGERFELAAALGNLADPQWLREGRDPTHAYWARVWAARALRYVWSSTAAPAVVAALADGQWRVREQAAKVVADRELADATDGLLGCLGDEVPRVRAAAATALAAVGEGEHAAPLHDLTADPDPAVSRAATRALRTLSRRLDRELA